MKRGEHIFPSDLPYLARTCMSSMPRYHQDRDDNSRKNATENDTSHKKATWEKGWKEMDASGNAASHQGQTVALYRKRKNWTQDDLATALRVDKRTVQRLEKQDTISNDDRRQLLVGLLGIPASMMGVAAKQLLAPRTTIAFNEDRMSFLEAEMTTRWEMYHYGGTTRAARGLDTWTHEIARFAASTRRTPWQRRAYGLLAMSYQLQNSTCRDMLAFDQAHLAYRQATKIARGLENPELIASAMAREGLTLLQEDRPQDAISILTGALETIRYSGLPHLKGYILQALSEAYAKAQESQLCWQAIGLAERALERAGDQEEMSHARITLATVTAQKGVDAVLLRDNDRAITLIERSLAHYDPTMIRGRARLTAQKAEAYQNLGLIDACVATAEEAITLAKSVGSQKTISRVKRLHKALATSRAKAQPGVARLGALLTVQ